MPILKIKYQFRPAYLPGKPARDIADALAFPCLVVEAKYRSNSSWRDIQAMESRLIVNDSTADQCLVEDYGPDPVRIFLTEGRVTGVSLRLQNLKDPNEMFYELSIRLAGNLFHVGLENCHIEVIANNSQAGGRPSNVFMYSGKKFTWGIKQKIWQDS